MAIGRRRFLQLSAIGIVAVLTDSACASDRALDQPDLLGMLGPDRVRELGSRYRSAAPTENNAAALRAALSDSVSARKSLDDQIRDDFAAGRTVLVDGWVLSLTEARQAALFSLTTA